MNIRNFNHGFSGSIDTYRVNGNVVAETDGTDITITPEIISNWVERYNGEVIIVTALD